MADFFSAPIENQNRTIKSMTVRVSNEGVEPADVRLEVFHAPQPDQGPSAKVMYVQRLVSLEPGTIQTFDNIFADLPVIDARVSTSGLGENTVAVNFVARDAAGTDLPGVIAPSDPIFPSDPILPPVIFATAPLDNQNGTIKSLIVRASNEGIPDVANLLLEVFHAPQTGDGPSEKVLYVQQLVSLDSESIFTFDNIFADLPVIDARLSVSGPGADFVAASFVARDAAGTLIPCVTQVFPPAPVIPD